MRFDWKPESKERYFRKAEAAVKAAGFDDILRVDRDQFSVVKGTVKVHFKPISRDGKNKSIFIHAYMILEMEEQDR
jgi:hypothetical protein